MTENSVFGPVPMYVKEWLARCTDVRSLADTMEDWEREESGVVGHWDVVRRDVFGTLEIIRGRENTQSGESLAIIMPLKVNEKELEVKNYADWTLWRAGGWLVGCALNKSSPSEYDVIARVPLSSIKTYQEIDVLYDRVKEGRDYVQEKYDAYIRQYNSERIAYAHHYADALEGNAEAQFKVGIAHLSGAGVPRDVKQGAEWVRMAANQGWHWAMLEIAKNTCGYYGTTAEESSKLYNAILKDDNAPEDCRQEVRDLFDFFRILNEKRV